MEKHGVHTNYLDHCRDQAIAEAGRMAARGFNARALNEHIRAVDRQLEAGSLPDMTVDEASRQVEQLEQGWNITPGPKEHIVFDGVGIA